MVQTRPKRISPIRSTGRLRPPRGKHRTRLSEEELHHKGPGSPPRNLPRQETTGLHKRKGRLKNPQGGGWRKRSKGENKKKKKKSPSCKETPKDFSRPHPGKRPSCRQEGRAKHSQASPRARVGVKGPPRGAAA